jgi:hypothetical protein
MEAGDPLAADTGKQRYEHPQSDTRYFASTRGCIFTGRYQQAFLDQYCPVLLVLVPGCNTRGVAGGDPAERLT